MGEIAHYRKFPIYKILFFAETGLGIGLLSLSVFFNRFAANSEYLLNNSDLIGAILVILPTLFGGILGFIIGFFRMAGQSEAFNHQNQIIKKILVLIFGLPIVFICIFIFMVMIRIFDIRM